jgi:hypothetical protein
MHKSTWDPLLLAVVFQGLSIIIALSLPETLPMPDSDDACDTSTVTANNQDTDEQSTFDGKSVKWIQQIRGSFAFVARDGAVLALVFTFLISKVGRQANNVLFQYASKKYGWTLSQASLFLCFSLLFFKEICISNRVNRTGQPTPIITRWGESRSFHYYTTFHYNLFTFEDRLGYQRPLDWEREYNSVITGEFYRFLVERSSCHGHW